MKHLTSFLLITLLLCFEMTHAAPLTGNAILEKVDANLSSESRIAVMSMTIQGARGSRTMKSKIWAQGMEKSYSEFLPPSREQGTKMLKLKDKLWTYDPSSDRTIMIAGHMLRQSMLGSDISYIDYMEDPRLSVLYDAAITGEESVSGVPCTVIELKAKKDDTAYPMRRLWVDMARFMPMRQDLMGKSGTLLKTLVVKEVFKVENRWYPRKMIYKDVMLEGNGTLIVCEAVQFNVEIPDYVFSKASLRR